jgi:glycosyltransferase involved in cell wall biosynthesis
MPAKRNPPRISVVLPVRNRGATRLENCLRSLRWQQIEPDRVEIIVSDFGSTPDAARSIEGLALAYHCQLRRVDTREVWNRSRALNIGIRAATADYVLCTDADMIFAPNFLPVALAAHERTAGRAFVVCKCHDLPPSVPLRQWRERDFDELSAQASVRCTFGTGACQSASRSFFERVRGYDEKYLFWGKEDTDMLVRATHCGLTLTWIESTTKMLHQWHRKNKRNAGIYWTMNRLRFAFTKNRIVKNDDRWGQVSGTRMRSGARATTQPAHSAGQRSAATSPIFVGSQRPSR